MDDPKEPAENLLYLHHEINKLFKDILHEEGFFDRMSFPVVDIIENNDSLRIEVEIPGLDKEDIKLQIVGEALVLEGTKLSQEDSDKISYICMERRFGSFRRVIHLPALVDATRISARHDKGVLIISIPKLKERRGTTQKIEIE